jgi:hypothetical protein
MLHFTKGSGESSKRREKQKWFQVTLKTDRFPAGMHGRNMAFGNGVAFVPLLPAAGFAQPRINAPALACNLFR